MESADVTIVGGGVIGCSLAYHLAKRGVDVVLLERETLGSQSTAHCAGGVRQQFSSEINVRLQQLSVRLLHEFEAETGGTADFRQVGYLFLLSRRDEVASFRDQLDMWHRLGLNEAHWVTPEEAKEISPLISVEGLLGGTFCPSDGLAGPNDVTFGYASAARRLGARLREGVEVTGIDVSGDRIERVRTSAGDVNTPAVLNCAGAWSAQIGHMVGVNLPVLPFPRHVFVTDSFPAISRSNPMTIDFSTSFYFHPEGDGVLFGMGDPDESPSFDTEVDWDFLDRVGEVANVRAPALLSAGLRTAWVGLYEVTPDHQPILGPVEEVHGLWCACGFSGHGFQMAPAVGRVLSRQMTEGHTDLELGAFSYHRFSDASHRPEFNVV